MVGTTLLNALNTLEAVREAFPRLYYIGYSEQQNSNGAIQLYIPLAWKPPLGDATLDQRLRIGDETQNPADLGPAITVSDYNNSAWWRWWEKDSGVFLGASKKLLFVTKDEIVEDKVVNEKDIDAKVEENSPPTVDPDEPATIELDYAIIDSLLGYPSKAHCLESSSNRYQNRPNADESRPVGNDYTIRFKTWAGCGMGGPSADGVEHIGFVARPADGSFVAVGRFKRLHAGDNIAQETLFDEFKVKPEKIDPTSSKPTTPTILPQARILVALVCLLLILMALVVLYRVRNERRS